MTAINSLTLSVLFIMAGQDLRQLKQKNRCGFPRTIERLGNWLLVPDAACADCMMMLAAIKKK
jgi:hypothetical protein